MPQAALEKRPAITVYYQDGSWLRMPDNTKIAMADGTKINADQLRPNDKLDNGRIVHKLESSGEIWSPVQS